MKSKTEMQALMSQARATNAERDEIERQVGVATPRDSGPCSWCRTMILAIETGLRTGDETAIAEGLSMLVDFEQMIRRGADKYEPWNL